MKQEHKLYSNGALTIVWKPNKCIHSAKCVRGLPAVFDTSTSPWIHAQGANSQTIIKQINQCPSGALSYLLNDTEMEKKVESNTPFKVEALKNGPYLIKGTIILKTTDGKEEKMENPALCRCGGSKNKPFCDGSHKQNGFEG